MLFRRLAFYCLLLATSLAAQISFYDPQQPLTEPKSKTANDQKCSLQGQVTNAITGAPVKKAAVNLELISGQREGYSTTSEADGSFKFDMVEPGSYKLSGTRQGYLNTQYGKKTARDPGVVLALKPTDKKTGVTLSLIPQGTISGKIVDEDGDPVANVAVSALHPAWMNGKSQELPHAMSQSNDLGEFRLINLPPGKYYVSAQQMQFQPQPDNSDVRAVTTYFPHEVSLATAAPVDVQAGQEMSGINIELVKLKTHHIRGTIVGDMGKSDVATLRLSVANTDDPLGFFAGGSVGKINRDRSFDMAGVAPGNHTLVLMDSNGRFQKLASQAIEMGSADLEGVALQIVPSGTILGQLTVQGEPVAGSTRVTLKSIHPILQPEVLTFPPDVNVKEDGSLLIPSVSPGKYHLYINPPAGTYLKSTKFQKQDVTGQELDLTQNPSGELEIILRYGPAEVNGTVKLSQDPATSPATEIVLIPEILNPDGTGVSTGEADQNGNFTVKNIRPGNYRAIALERLDVTELENPELLKQLQSLGTAIELKENDRKQLSLERISTSDLERLLQAIPSLPQ